MFGINESNEFIKDGSVVEIVGGRGKVGIDKPKKLKIDLFSLFDQLY